MLKKRCHDTSKLPVLNKRLCVSDPQSDLKLFHEMCKPLFDDYHQKKQGFSKSQLVIKLGGYDSKIVSRNKVKTLLKEKCTFNDSLQQYFVMEASCIESPFTTPTKPSLQPVELTFENDFGPTPSPLPQSAQLELDDEITEDEAEIKTEAFINKEIVSIKYCEPSNYPRILSHYKVRFIGEAHFWREQYSHQDMIEFGVEECLLLRAQKRGFTQLKGARQDDWNPPVHTDISYLDGNTTLVQRQGELCVPCCMLIGGNLTNPVLDQRVAEYLLDECVSNLSDSGDIFDAGKVVSFLMKTNLFASMCTVARVSLPNNELISFFTRSCQLGIFVVIGENHCFVLNFTSVGTVLCYEPDPRMPKPFQCIREPEVLLNVFNLMNIGQLSQAYEIESV